MRPKLHITKTRYKK